MSNHILVTEYTYKSSLNDDIRAVDYWLKSHIPGEYMEIKSSLF